MRKLFLIIVMFLLIPFIVNAEEIRIACTSFDDATLTGDTYDSFDGDTDLNMVISAGITTGVTDCGISTGECVTLPAGTSPIESINTTGLLGVVEGDFTFTAWIKLEDDADPGNILTRGAESACDMWGLVVTGGDLDFQGFSPACDITTGRNGAFMKGTWTHVVVTWDGTSIKTYFNGTIDIDATPPISTPDTKLLLGNSISMGAGSNLGLSVDELKLYSSALTVGEILADYNSGDGVACPSPSAETLTLTAKDFHNDSILNSFTAIVSNATETYINSTTTGDINFDNITQGIYDITIQ